MEHSTSFLSSVRKENMYDKRTCRQKEAVEEEQEQEEEIIK